MSPAAALEEVMELRCPVAASKTRVSETPLPSVAEVTLPRASADAASQ